MGYIIEMSTRHDIDTSKVDLDLFEAALTDEGFIGHSVDVRGNTASIKMENGLMDAIMNDDEKGEELTEVAVRLADNFGINATSVAARNIETVVQES